MYIVKLKRLYELRKNHDLTQDAVAELLGVGRTTYAMYEQGNREMDYTSLLKVADYYQVPLDYLFERTDNPIHLESYTPDEVEYLTNTLALYRSVKQKFM
ncbi:helix-turn-helix domain-containing protein [Terribacillus sp. DMT04]|uniref:helix-turn-helix domain-containing protein n=1 Tax=Terribacillus sp. DMT04 TaxID=2850441 RepID=UPI00352F4800